MPTLNSGFELKHDGHRTFSRSDIEFVIHIKLVSCSTNFLIIGIISNKIICIGKCLTRFCILSYTCSRVVQAVGFKLNGTLKLNVHRWKGWKMMYWQKRASNDEDTNRTIQKWPMWSNQFFKPFLFWSVLEGHVFEFFHLFANVNLKKSFLYSIGLGSQSELGW